MKKSTQNSITDRRTMVMLLSPGAELSKFEIKGDLERMISYIKSYSLLFDIVLVSSDVSSYKSLVKKRVGVDIEHITLPFLPGKILRNIYYFSYLPYLVRKRLRRKEISVIKSFGVPAEVIASRIRNESCRTILLWDYEWAMLKARRSRMPLLNTGFRYLENKALRNSDYIFTSTDFLRERLIEKGVSESRIRVTPNGINLRLFSCSQSKLSLRNKHGFSKKDFIVLYVGQIVKNKGVEFLIECASKLCVLDKNAKFILVGDGALRRKLEKKTSFLGLSKNVSFFGFVQKEKLWEYYSMADIFFFPSSSEGQPSVILEAWAAHLPIIATDVPGINNLVTHNSTGLLIKENDSLELLMNCRLLRDNKKVRDKITVNGHKKVQDFSIEKMHVHELRQIFEVLT
jgi:glycosyltransferase involved in cell wall biosynthesis